MPAQVETDKVILKGPSNSSITIYLNGATITSWIADGQERLFLSKNAILNGTKAIRGGIPIVFPIFGTVKGNPLPQHGFARISKWIWANVDSDTDDSVTAHLDLKPDQVPENLYKLWAKKFHLTYYVTISAKQLITKLVVRNTDTSDFEFTTLLHTYFNVHDVTKIRVTGLKDIEFIDKLVESSSKSKEGRDHITINGEIDRVYESVGNSKLTIDGADIEIEKINFPDVVVWNPWIEKAKGMSDFGDEEYKNMICVEVGRVSSFVSLASGTSWEGSQTLTVA